MSSCSTASGCIFVVSPTPLVLFQALTDFSFIGDILNDVFAKWSHNVGSVPTCGYETEDMQC